MNIKDFIEGSIRDMSQKYRFSPALITNEMENSDLHIDIALPLGMLFTILTSNLIKKLQALDKNTLHIHFISKEQSHELVFGGLTPDIFGHNSLLGYNRAENELLEALIKQMKAEYRADIPIFLAATSDKFRLCATRG